MKKINSIIAVTALLFTVACNRDVEFQKESFITLDNSSFSISEGIGTIQIPVSIVNHKGDDIQVIVKFEDGEGERGAVKGVDYTVVYPEDEVLRFSKKDTTQFIEIEINPEEGLTGSKTFDLKILSATDGYPVGGFNTATVKILDDDHPLAAFIGEWSGELDDEYSQMTYETTINIEALDGDESYTKLRIDSGLDPVYAKNSKVKFSAESTDGTKLKIGQKQLNGYQDFFITGLDISMYFTDIVFELQENGTLMLTTDYAVVVPDETYGYAMAAYYMSGAIFTKN